MILVNNYNNDKNSGSVVTSNIVAKVPKKVGAIKLEIQKVLLVKCRALNRGKKSYSTPWNFQVFIAEV